MPDFRVHHGCCNTLRLHISTHNLNPVYLQDRTDRELVTPWFKFLWETYRTVLDILRNNRCCSRPLHKLNPPWCHMRSRFSLSSLRSSAHACALNVVSQTQTHASRAAVMDRWDLRVLCSRLESLYAMTAGKAFHFCLAYKRTTEFRRLCDTLRNHLANLNKYRDQRDRPDLSLPETQQLYLETRFEQLKVRTCVLVLCLITAPPKH